MMQAICCSQAQQIELIERPIPEPKPGEALLRIKRIGVCGSDLHAYLGQQNFFSYPRIFGHELAAEIVSLNGNTENELRIGDRVIIIPYIACGSCIACRQGKPNCCAHINVIGVHSDGGMCEYLTVPSQQLLRCNSLTWEQMAVVECLSIGAHGVSRAKPAANSNVIVLGTSAIGIGTIQFAQASGANVIAIDLDAQRLDFCAKHLKVSATIHAHDNVQEKIYELTAGDMATTVFDATGNIDSMRQAFHYVAHGGQLIFIGHIKDDIVFNDADFHQREMTVMASRNATRADFEHVVQMLEEKKINVDCMINDQVSLKAAAERFPYWLDRKNHIIKAIINMEA